MINTNASVELPNPLTPMAFFPPDIARQVTISLYVLVGSSSVLIWDVIGNLKTDLNMARRYRVNAPLVVYFVSRLSSLVHILGITVIQTAPVSQCKNLVIEGLYPIVIPSTSLLFFFRIRALYDGNPRVIGFFSFMWLAVVAGCITPLIGATSVNIGTTRYCTVYRLEPYVFAASVIPFFNDTFIFCATSWRLWQTAHVSQSLQNTAKVMILGQYLPSFTRALLKDGQIYYLTIISLNVVTASLFFNPSIPVPYRSFIGVPNIVLMNTMACHVYRNIRLGVYLEPTDANMTMPTYGCHKKPSEIIFKENRDLEIASVGVQTMALDLVEEMERTKKTSVGRGYNHHHYLEYPIPFTAGAMPNYF